MVFFLEKTSTRAEKLLQEEGIKSEKE